MNDQQPPAATPVPAPASEGRDRPRVPPQPEIPADSALQPRWDRHPVNIRITIPLLFRSYYLTIVAGPERRSRERRISERKKHPLFMPGNIVFLFVFGSFVGLAIMVLLKWLAVTLGLDSVVGTPG